MMKHKTIKIQKYSLIFLLIIGAFSPLTAKAGWIDDVFKAITLSEMIPDQSCIRSVDGRIEDSTQRGEDERGLKPSLMDLITGDHNPCSQEEICRVTGSGQIDGNLEDERRYDLLVEWGDCVPTSETGDQEGIISNLRQGLNDLRSIFPARLSSERGIINTVGAIIRWALGIAGAIFILMIVYGGFQYLIVGSNEKNIDKAKTTITYAVIGMVIIAGAWLIADFVISMLLRGA